MRVSLRERGEERENERNPTQRGKGSESQRETKRA